MEDQIKQVLDEIRPYLQAEGGDVEFVKLEGKTVHVRLKGAGAGCPAATMTLRYGIERKVKEVVPEVESVVSVP